MGNAGFALAGHRAQWRVYWQLRDVAATTRAARRRRRGRLEATPAAAVEKFPADTTLGKIQEKGEITIGVKFDVPPFGVKNPQSGEVEGFDVEMGKAVAAKLGVKPKFIEAISDNRIPFLEDGTADLILSTMTINEERVAQIAFSDPYFIARGRVLVPGDSSITGVADLAGKNVCTALGSTYEANLKKQAPEAKLKLVDSYSECLELVQNGAVDAVSTDDVILTGMIIQDDTLKLVGDQLTQEPYGAGIKKGDTEMVDFVNGVFQGLKDDGTWAKLHEQWIGKYTGEKGEVADHRGRRSGRARQEQLALARRPHRPLARVQLGLLGHGAPRGDLVRDRHGRRHPRGGAEDRADQVAATDRRGVCGDLPQHPAAGPAVHLLRRAAAGRRGHQRVGRRDGVARPVHGGLRRRGPPLGRLLRRQGQIEASLSLGFSYRRDAAPDRACRRRSARSSRRSAR